MNLDAQKVLLGLVVSRSIERRVKLGVFDCVMNILGDYEYTHIFLAEDALEVFTDMLGDRNLSVEETIQCLKSSARIALTGQPFIS